MAVTYTPSGDGARILEAMLKKITAQGGQAVGDGQKGTFKVQGFGGSYVLDGGALTLSVTDKPVFVPDSMIEAWLRQNLG